MRLLYWTPFFLPDTGGIELVAARVLPHFRRTGYQIKVVASYGMEPAKPVEEFEGISVHRFHFHEMFRCGDLKAILATQRQVDFLKQEFDPDVVHFNLSDPSVFFHLRSRSARKPTLVALHQDLRNEKHQKAQGELFWQAIREADWVTSVCSSNTEIVLRNSPEITGRLSVEHNPIDVTQYSDSSPRFFPPRLLCLARLVPVKGVERAIEAMRIILTRFPEATLTVAGDGIERERLEQRVMQLGIASSVGFLGAVKPDLVPDLIESSSVLLLPSRSEGFPNVALESAASARPMVAFPVGEVEKVIRNGETGLVVAQGDVKGMADAVCSLLIDPRKAMQMGRAARALVNNRFGIDAYVESYHQLYSRIAAGAKN
jgi:glycogen(starch) synthase